MTDRDFLLDVLSDGQPHTLNEILTRSFRERECGLTVHSRVADLRHDGYKISNRTVKGMRRGARSVYQLEGRDGVSQMGARP